jgi:hypothetical protein
MLNFILFFQISLLQKKKLNYEISKINIDSFFCKFLNFELLLEWDFLQHFYYISLCKNEEN